MEDLLVLRLTQEEADWRHCTTTVRISRDAAQMWLGHLINVSNRAIDSSYSSEVANTRIANSIATKLNTLLSQ